MQIIKIISIIIVTFSTLCATKAQDVPYFNGNVYEALATAQSDHKMLIIEFYAPWNYKSRWSHDNVIAKKRVYQELNISCVIAIVDTQTKEGATLAAQYEVTDYPTFLLFNQNGNVIDKIEGTLDETDFLTRINQVMLENDGKSALKLRRIFTAAQKNDSETADKLASAFINERDKRQIISPVFWDMFSNSSICYYDSKTFEFMLQNKTEFDSVFTKQIIEDKINDIITTQAMRYAVGTLDYDSTQLSMLTQKMQCLSDSKQDVISMLCVLSTYRRNNDVDMYIETVSRLLRNIEQESLYQIMCTLDFVARNGNREQKRTARHLIERYVQSKLSSMQLDLINSLSERLSE